MTPEQLKASILQMAIQGKLVEQRPEEGTAEELYQKIKTKEKEIPDSQEEKPFEIPDSWKWVKLGNVLKISTGKKDANHGKENGKYDFYTCSAEPIKADTFSFEGECLITPGNGANVGLIILHKGKFEAYQRTYVLEKYSEKAYMKFFKYAMDWNWKQYNADKMFGSAIPYIKLGNLQNYSFPLPPLEEQHRIVAKIEELLPYVDRYAEAYEKLEKFNAKFPEDMKKSILQYAIQGKLVEQRPEEGTAEELYQRIKANQPTLKNSKSDLVFDAMDFDIPGNWKWVEVNQIFDFVDYRGKTPNKISEGVFLVTASNIRQGFMDYTRKEHISKEEYETRKSRGITEKGDLLFTTEAPMGNAAICDLDECSCGQRVITFKEYTMGTVDQKLFMYFILSPAFQKQLVDNCTGTTAKGIKADKLKHLLIPLPPIDEQKRIAKKIEELLPFCNRLSEWR